MTSFNLSHVAKLQGSKKHKELYYEPEKKYDIVIPASKVRWVKPEQLLLFVDVSHQGDRSTIITPVIDIVRLHSSYQRLYDASHSSVSVLHEVRQYIETSNRNGYLPYVRMLRPNMKELLDSAEQFCIVARFAFHCYNYQSTIEPGENSIDALHRWASSEIEEDCRKFVELFKKTLYRLLSDKDCSPKTDNDDDTNDDPENPDDGGDIESSSFDKFWDFFVQLDDPGFFYLRLICTPWECPPAIDNNSDSHLYLVCRRLGIQPEFEHHFGYNRWFNVVDQLIPVHQDTIPELDCVSESELRVHEIERRGNSQYRLRRSSIPIAEKLIHLFIRPTDV